MGLSPRVRGNRGRSTLGTLLLRSIPARAGEPSPSWKPPSARRVYPRACGGTFRELAGIRRIIGLSPRVRGNPSRQTYGQLAQRSIPARAGEPDPLHVCRQASTVYPRACGGTAWIRGHCTAQTGLSPRVRGNLLVHRVNDQAFGSIPARAGEPHGSEAIARPRRVYPRACGGTSWFTASTIRLSGLSPRVRGNRKRPHRSGGTWRSIPARAGEPGGQPFRVERRGVYPRACGGTQTDKLFAVPNEGLSPRVRGNPVRTDVTVILNRSIPARAGEPRPPAFPRGIGSVYPRACGGTATDHRVAGSLAGLSPRVRGNLVSFLVAAGAVRSIPARAGEPNSMCQWAMSTPVYPRACGGTGSVGPLPACPPGLSPRVRGNRISAIVLLIWRRSIPARAGEPLAGRPRHPVQRVYPRACGGTCIGSSDRPVLRGLSPRVRGNRLVRQPSNLRRRSIPARAGEPGQRHAIGG